MVMMSHHESVIPTCTCACVSVPHEQVMREYDAQGQDDVGPSRYLWSSGETVSQVGVDVWVGTWVQT